MATAKKEAAPESEATNGSGTPVKVTFKRTRSVTLPLFKWPVNEERFYRFEEPMFVAKPIKKGRGGDDEQKKQPPTLAHVTNLETGEMGQIILGTVLKDILNDEYPDNGYVGKSFGIIKHSIEGNRAYATYSVTEVEAE